MVNGFLIGKDTLRSSQEVHSRDRMLPLLWDKKFDEIGFIDLSFNLSG